MRKPRLIFYIVYFLFHLGLLLASISVNYKSEDFEFLLWLRGKMDIMIYVSIAGLVLFFIDVVLVTMDNRSKAKEREKLEHEINSMKAKMFDLQEATRNTPRKTEVVAPKKTEDQDKSNNG